MIHPMIGKTVWYFGTSATEPSAAIITRVHGDLLVDVEVLTSRNDPRSAHRIRLCQPEDTCRAERVEWPPWVVEEEAFRKKVDEFADQRSAKLDTLSQLIEEQLGTMDERLSFAVAEHGKTAKLVAQQADAVISIRGWIGRLHDRLSAIEPEMDAQATNVEDADMETISHAEANRDTSNAGGTRSEVLIGPVSDEE